MPDEPPGAGPGMSGSFSGKATSSGLFGRQKSMNVQADFALNIPGLDTAAAGLGAVNTQLQALQESLKALTSNKYQLQQGINGLLSGIEAQANSTASAIAGVTSAVGGLGAGGGGGGGGGRGAAAPSKSYGAYGTAQGAGWESGAIASAGDAQAAAGGTSGAGGLAAPMLGGGGFLGMIGDISMMPLRFMRDRIQNNRQSSLYMQQAMSQQAFATGRSSAEGMMGMMGSLANMPNGIMGTQADVMGIMGTGRQIGAQFGYGGMNGTRAGGYLTSISQLQRMSPGTPSAVLAQQLGGQISNLGAEKESAFMTGGVFGLTGMGGKMKSVQEWAEGILRWLENQRPGRDRGKPFTYGEMLAQHFPGSNIDAWLTVNGVSPDMKEYFWTYAEGKATKTGSTQGGPFEIAEPRGNLAFERVRSQQAFTKNEFALASKMSGQYANREQSNQWFNQLMGQIVNKVIPAVTGPGGPLNIIQNLPDFIEDLLFGLLEGGGPIAQMAGGGMVMGSVGAFGDVGDIGDYGTEGGTSTAGLHPDMRRKVNAMMKANPNLTVSSGLRDTGTQQRLKRRGFKNVSGGPSAHTRGMAADLGPRSQYDWIAANAKKFGLSSGKSHGEPWHVGMGDIGEIPGQGIIGGAIDKGGDLLQKLPSIPGSGLWLAQQGANVADAAGGAGNILEMLGNLFKGLLNSVESVGTMLGGGMGSLLNFSSLLSGEGNVQDTLKEGVPGLMSALMGNFLTYGAKATSTQGFNAGFSAGMPTSFTFGAMGKADGGGGAGKTFTPGTLPSGGGPMSAADVARAASSVGFHGDALQKIVAIAHGESGLNPTSHNAVPPDNSYGLWQINMHGGLGPDRRARYGLGSNDELFNPVTNARAAWDISGGGTNFRPWSVYTSGKYSQYMDEAASGMAAAGVGDVDDLGIKYSKMMPFAQSAGGGQVVFHNTFHVDGGGGSGGGMGTQIDMRRTVTQLADHLEAEMKRRAARSN